MQVSDGDDQALGVGVERLPDEELVVTAASAECPFLGVGIRIEPSEIAAMLLEAAAILDDAPARAPGIAVASAGAPLLDALATITTTRSGSSSSPRSPG